MASNFIEPGNVQEFTAPAGGVTGGAPVLIGSVVVVPVASAPAGARFNGALVGTWALPKAAGAWSEGQVLYFDSAAGNFAAAASPTARRAGAAMAAAAADATTGVVRLNNISAAVNVA